MTVFRESRFVAVMVVCLGFGGLMALPAVTNGQSPVVINELHINPDVKTDLVEFIELHNTGQADVDLSGWCLSEGVFYTFPEGAVLPAAGYVIVGQNPDHILTGAVSVRFNIPEALVFGPYGGQLSNEGERVVLRNAGGEVVDRVDYRLGFPWPTVGDAIPAFQPGTGHSMQLVNPAFDNDLAGSWRSGSPTPAAQNGVFATNIPPHIRQVKHTPGQPRSGQPVTITAKITDPDGVIIVGLSYQIVEPGQYRTLDGRLYDEDWVSLMMTDDGLNGDLRADDGIYTLQIPASVQIHRRLIRYRLTVIDTLGFTAVVPYADDPQPNFAYFVYDGVPSWTGAISPGQTEVQYSSEVMQSLPVYHLLADEQDVRNAMHLPGGNQGAYQGSDYLWQGTLVYEGKVYDHIRFRARGGVWRYAMGKNMWKFDFNRGHSFQARDDYGRSYDTTWDKLNFSACIQQGDYMHRGEHGVFEAGAFRLFNLMGVQAPKTNWVHFRVIDNVVEAGPTQYDGDFWGLYMNIEQMDGRFLDEHNLPDGNLYKMDSQVGNDLNNQGPTAATNKSDLSSFQAGYRSRPGEDWWRDNVNLEGYYGYRCVVEGVHHGDIAYGKNWFFYLNPETNLWSMLPWDVDLTWANNMYGSGEDDFKRTGNLFSNSNLSVEFQNRSREFFDLLYNTDQLYQLLDEMADIIDSPAHEHSFVDADRAMWDYNPIMTSAYVNPSKAGQGRFYQRAATHDFRGMVQIMKDYAVSNNRAFNTYFEDQAVPDTPVVTATGPTTSPINALTFMTSPFADPQGAQTFDAMQWRIGQVSSGSQPAVDDPSSYVFVPDGAQWRYFKGTQEPSAAVGAWRTLDFDDSDWFLGRAAIGYGESFIATELNDMRGQYTTIYLRRTFEATRVESLTDLIIEVKYDDGVNVWINDHLVFQENVTDAELPYDATALFSGEAFDFVYKDLGVPGDVLVDGTNIITVQVLNSTVYSSDCAIDVRLTAQRDQDGGETPLPPQVYRGEPGVYEISAVWDSGELPEFDDHVTIPASVVRSGRTYRVRCRMKDDTGRWSHWSAPVQFLAGDPVAAGILSDLRVTEVMYNPNDWAGDKTIDNDGFEFIELKNIGDDTLDLASVSLTEGVRFDFGTGDVTTLRPGDFVLVVRNRSAFVSRYGSQLAGLIAGEYDGKLANDGENVALVDFWNGTIAAFQYNDGAGWPLAADGAGHSLVPLESAILNQPDGSLRYGGNWRASIVIGGSPGRDDPEPVVMLAINEVMANTTNADGGPNDWIELYNPMDSDIDLTDWYLSDNPAEPNKWALPAGVIPAHGFVSFDEVTGFHNAANAGFGLSKAGEAVVLSYLPGTPEDAIVDAVAFDAQEAHVSLGRYPDGGPWWFRMVPSRDAANVVPMADVVIDEVMYHPVDANDEYIELFNPTNSTIALASVEGPWRLDGAVEYTFDPSLSIPAGGCIVIVGFDPLVETARLDAFGLGYGASSLVPGVTVVGPWQGALANEGERVVLEKPLAGDDPTDPTVWATVDDVIYSDVSPWPVSADGQGDALHRISIGPADSGYDPVNWEALTPSPGSRW